MTGGTGRPTPTVRHDDPPTGPTSVEALAEEDGRAMGRALLARPETERAAWWRGAMAVLDGGLSSYRGLPEPPGGYQWGEDVGHSLRGSHGLAHLIPRPPAGTGHVGALTAVCAFEAVAWVRIGRWETEHREACPQCTGQTVIS